MEGFFAGTLAYHQRFLIYDVLFAVTALGGAHLSQVIVRGSQHPQVAFAFAGTAVALSEGSLEEIELVVECELLVLADVLQSENTHAYLSKDIPLLGLAIWLARVIDQAGHIAHEGWINYLVVCCLH